jgi:predicted dehydrogenase
MSTEHNAPVSGASRREFLKSTAAATAAVAATGILKTPVYGQNQAPSANVNGANNRIVVGFIGVGGQGTNAHVQNVVRFSGEHNAVGAAVADVSKTRVANALELLNVGIKDKTGAVTATQNHKAEGYADYRKLLERKDIDAIFCATVDHWHTKICVDAMNAGKHVYVEKPMTRYLGEAFEIYDAVKKTGKILQVGSQGCSDMKWHEAARLIKSGKIGPIVMSQGSYMRNNPKGEWNYAIQSWCTAEDTDWNMWINPVSKKIPFNADHYFRWRKYYPYCAGLLGDLFPHKLHPYMLATGNPEFPTRVACVGSKKFETDKNTPDTPPRDVPEIVQLIAEFPSGYVMHITSSTVNEEGSQEMIRGHKANLTMAGNKVELKPQRAFAEEIDPYTSPAFPGENVPNHHKNWFDSIRANKQPNAGIDLAVKVQTVISLAEMSERLSIMCSFDPKTRKITDGTGKEVKALTYGSLPLS